MDLETGIAIGAATLANVVAAVSIVVGWKSHGRELQHARRLTDLESVRTILDEAAVALHRTKYSVDDVGLRLVQQGPQGFFKAADGVKLYEDFTNAGKELDALLPRLKIQFDRHSDGGIVDSFEGATEATLEIFRALGRIRLEQPAEAGDQAAQQQVRKLLREDQKAIEEHRKIFDSQRERFFQAAQRTAGANLPSEKR
jgi:hypothetical protein